MSQVCSDGIAKLHEWERKYIERRRYERNPGLCKELLEKEAEGGIASGWCVLSRKAPTKNGGYV